MSDLYSEIKAIGNSIQHSEFPLTYMTKQLRGILGIKEKEPKFEDIKAALEDVNRNPMFPILRLSVNAKLQLLIYEANRLVRSHDMSVTEATYIIDKSKQVIAKAQADLKCGYYKEPMPPKATSYQVRVLNGLISNLNTSIAISKLRMENARKIAKPVTKFEMNIGITYSPLRYIVWISENKSSGWTMDENK